MKSNYISSQTTRFVYVLSLAIAISSCSTNRAVTTKSQDRVKSNSNHVYVFNTKSSEYDAFLGSDFDSSPIFQASTYQRLTSSNSSNTITKNKYIKSEINTDKKINPFFEGKSDFRSEPAVINFIASKRNHAPFFETLKKPLVELRYISACNGMSGPIVMNSRNGQPTAFLSIPNNSSCVKQLDPHRFGENKGKRLSVYRNSNHKRTQNSSFNRSRPVGIDRTSTKSNVVYSSDKNRLKSSNNSSYTDSSRSTRNRSNSVRSSGSSRSSSTSRSVSRSGDLRSSVNSRSISR